MKKFILATLLLLAAFVVSNAQSPAGTWVLYPAQTNSYSTAVQQPINADKSSVFKSTGKAVIPVKFSLWLTTGPAVFESILSDNETANDYSYLSFTPSSELLVKDISNLTTGYNFSLGDCHGGALRWSVNVGGGKHLFIYYGAYANFTDCTTASQSGTNMIDLGDLRYDTSQLAGGTFYDTYTHAMELVGNMPALSVSLVLDAGWAGDQRLTLTSAAVNSNTWTPTSGGAPVQTCELPANATIQISKESGAEAGGVIEEISIQPKDDNLMFRIVDCNYMYNLATSSLSGPGKYKVEAVINDCPALGPAFFELK